MQLIALTLITLCGFLCLSKFTERNWRYSGRCLMGSLWDQEKLIPITN
jgi:hypothetical protein